MFCATTSSKAFGFGQESPRLRPYFAKTPRKSEFRYGRMPPPVFEDSHSNRLYTPLSGTITVIQETSSLRSGNSPNETSSKIAYLNSSAPRNPMSVPGGGPRAPTGVHEVTYCREKKDPLEVALPQVSRPPDTAGHPIVAKMFAHLRGLSSRNVHLYGSVSGPRKASVPRLVNVLDQSMAISGRCRCLSRLYDALLLDTG
ncbi:hypothetical protein F5876DRAFT_68503 [Lentinula aff. lateritia]|uniref:Uncharacterized protein n=1 Tax=Lentinula aff. lateritia TaxID=2804960 RepID=A0ACC1TQU8_9AGAR|nr:hypothetical protein F5876DRAFT_68503 [Lentinula aff. lateritia]